MWGGRAAFLSSCLGVKAHGLGRPLPFSKHMLGMMCLTLKQICTRIKSLRQSFGILKKKKRNYQSDGKKKKKEKRIASLLCQAKGVTES